MIIDNGNDELSILISGFWGVKLLKVYKIVQFRILKPKRSRHRKVLNECLAYLNFLVGLVTISIFYYSFSTLDNSTSGWIQPYQGFYNFLTDNNKIFV